MAEKTEAQKRAQKAYMEKFVRVEIRMDAERRAAVQAHAEAHGESVNGFINRAIDQTMSRDDLKGHTAASAGAVDIYSESEKAAPTASDGSVEDVAGNGAERRGDNE